jgi:hypothetical protein
MKNILVSSIVCLLFVTSISAQNFNYSPSQELVGQLAGEWPEFTISFEPSSPEAIQYDWEIIENSLPMDWDMSLCDYNTCYALLPSSASMSPISLEDAKSGTKGFFKITFLSYKTDTTATISFYVYDSKDKSRGDTVSFTFSRTTSVANNNFQNIEIYPNPSSSLIHFDVAESNSTIRIMNFAGKILIEETEVNAGQKSLNLSHLPKGLYFVNISGGDRNYQSKIVVQ